MKIIVTVVLTVKEREREGQRKGGREGGREEQVEVGWNSLSVTLDNVVALL